MEDFGPHPTTMSTTTTLEELSLKIKRAASAGCRIDVRGDGKMAMLWIAWAVGLDAGVEVERCCGIVFHHDVFFHPDPGTVRRVAVPLSRVAGRAVWVVNPDDSVTKL